MSIFVPICLIVMAVCYAAVNAAAIIAFGSWAGGSSTKTFTVKYGAILAVTAVLLAAAAVTGSLVPA